jgi:hypothetical protein
LATERSQKKASAREAGAFLDRSGVHSASAKASRQATNRSYMKRCGHVLGVANEIAPYTGLRFVCYCHDCQAFARFLKRPDVLDAAGGPDIFQMPVGRLKLIEGKDVVRCLRLSGKVYRWYTDCCQTPIGNTAGPHFPIVGLILYRN